MAHSHARYERRHATPRWCFAPAAFNLPRNYPHLKSYKDGAGDDCVDDQIEGRKIAEAEDRHVSRSTMVAKAESEIHDALGRRAEQQAGLDEHHGFHHQVLEYEAGEEYAVHTDCNNAANDRAGTALVYLTDVEEGGETCFPRRGTCVRPRKGSAVFFQSRTRDRCDKMSEHIARSVKRGKKIVVQRWYYTQFLIPTGETDSILCDIGNNCRHYMYNQSRVEAVKMGEQGQAAKAAGKAREAQQLYQQGVDAYPTYPYTAAWLGEALYNDGRAGEALPHFRNALRASGLFPDAHWFAGSITAQMNRLEEAEHHFRHMLKAVPRDRDANYMLGDVLAKRAAAAGGAAESRKLRKLAPASLRTHLSINPGDDEARKLAASLE